MIDVIRKFLYYFQLIFTIPHLFLFRISDDETKNKIIGDISAMNERLGINRRLSFYLIKRPPYRNLFYHRIGNKSKAVCWLLPPYPMFIILPETNIEEGAFVLNHPFSTILNAKRIGKNFTCCHLTTIGNKNHGDNNSRPIIGDNVSLGANVSIIGDITIGNNVIIGAGSVVVKDVPDNCTVVGNPARIIKYSEYDKVF